ncbi:MAG: LacI family transcriptional regulator [Bacteroides sp.]|nr:LacI family transcriptional regulator [Bacteroides sp.]
MSLKDIARELRVSVSTVSRALKNSPEIGPETREKVQELARRWNYRPNPFAMSLLKDAPRLIGIIVPEIVSHFYSSIISGISDTARKEGYSVIITSSYEQYEREKECLENLVNVRVEGIAACLSQETREYKHFEAIKNLNIPLIFFDRVCLKENFSCVVSDNVESARKATELLIRRGANRIGFIGGSNHLEIVTLRKRGYLEALHTYKIPIEKELIVCQKMSYQEGREATRRLLSLPRPPEAILAMNDTLAFAAMKEIRKRKLRIPDDLSLIGYTDEEHANYVEPTLTAVTHPTYEMGETACHLLLEAIQGKGTVRQIVVPTRLEIRDSTLRRNMH